MRALTKNEALDMRRFGIKGPIAVIPNGVEIRADATPGPFWAAHGELRARRTVLFLGRIHYKKGLEVLCRAWERISRRFPEGCLVIAGPNFEGTQEAVMQLVEDLGITRTVKFVGMLRGDMKWSALAAADAFVLPSYSEGFSVAMLEAMAMGLPVIVSRACCFPEISSKQCGWIVEPGLEELTDALMQFFRTSPAVTSRMGANGREVVRNQYSWSTIGEQVVEVYDWLLGGPRPQSVEVT
jgi:glycosyltransferase involved in cell wall biosynthesis